MTIWADNKNVTVEWAGWFNHAYYMGKRWNYKNSNISMMSHFNLDEPKTIGDFLCQSTYLWYTDEFGPTITKYIIDMKLVRIEVDHKKTMVEKIYTV